MNFNFIDNIFKLIDRGFDELDKKEQQKFGALLANSDAYQRICRRISAGMEKEREAWETPVDHKYNRDRKKSD